MGSEIVQRDEVETLIAGSSVWQGWTQLSESDSRGRIAFSDIVGEEVPACSILLGPSNRSRRGQQRGAMNQAFKAGGSLIVSFFDVYDSTGVDAAGDDMVALQAAIKAEDRRFGAWVTDLIDEVVGSSRLKDKSRMWLGRIDFENVPWHRSRLNVEHEGLEGKNESDMFDGPFWTSETTWTWGPFE